MASLEAQVTFLERASEPGLEHRGLERFVGSFDTTLVLVGTDGKESELARGDAQLGWVLGNRYLRWDAGLVIAGQRRESSAFLGFDRRAGEHCLMTITSFSTGMIVARGTGDPARTGIRFILEQTDPGSGATMRMTSVLRSVDADHFVLDQLGPDASGRERVLQRTHYRRSGAPAVKT